MHISHHGGVGGAAGSEVLHPRKPSAVLPFFKQDGAAIPEPEWLSVGAITDQLEQLSQPFRTAIPATVIDRLADIGIESNPDDGATSGVTFKGKIYLIREGRTDSASVARTLGHELLHFGLRRFYDFGASDE